MNMYEFDFYKDSWMILIESEEEFDALVRDFRSNYWYSIPFKYESKILGLTNTTDAGEVCDSIMWLGVDNLEKYERPLIKVNYFKVVGSMESPQTKKTESELQLEQVMSKLSELQKEAQRLQEIVAKENK